MTIFLYVNKLLWPKKTLINFFPKHTHFSILCYLLGPEKKVTFNSLKLSRPLGADIGGRGSSLNPSDYNETLLCFHRNITMHSSLNVHEEKSEEQGCGQGIQCLECWRYRWRGEAFVPKRQKTKHSVKKSRVGRDCAPPPHRVITSVTVSHQHDWLPSEVVIITPPYSLVLGKEESCPKSPIPEVMQPQLKARSTQLKSLLLQPLWWAASQV